MSITSRVLSIIGPSPIGDVSSMRAHATQLNAVAAQLEAAATHVRATAVPGEGGFVRRNHAWCEHKAGDLLAQAHALRELAQMLSRQATSTEQGQQLWHHRFATVERELVAAARKVVP
jgi:hypothetical protein